MNTELIVTTQKENRYYNPQHGWVTKLVECSPNCSWSRRFKPSQGWKRFFEWKLDTVNLDKKKTMALFAIILRYSHWSSENIRGQQVQPALERLTVQRFPRIPPSLPHPAVFNSRPQGASRGGQGQIVVAAPSDRFTGVTSLQYCLSVCVSACWGHQDHCWFAEPGRTS